MNAPAPRTTFQQQVVDQLGQAIARGDWPPGAALPAEAELCTRFGFSRIVIREAVKSLAAKGLLEVRRRVGTLVQPAARWNLFDPDVMTWRTRAADPAMARDLMELRRIVEPAAARLAAQKASAGERAALRAAYEAMARAVAGQGDYVQADLAFHTAILAACGNPYVHQMQQALTQVLRATFEVVVAKPGGPAQSLPLHEAICRAVERGQADAAERATLTLIDRAAADLQEQLQAPPRRAAAPTPRTARTPRATPVVRSPARKTAR